MNSYAIYKRFRTLRKKSGMSQDDLSTAMCFNDRQTISAIESGVRKISAEELIVASQIFDVGLDFFTDPFRLVGDEGRFSWRQHEVNEEQLDAFQDVAGQWIAAYRYLSDLKDDIENPILPRLGLTTNSSFEEAQSDGEKISRVFELGDIPAENLQSVIENKLGVLVLYVDGIHGVSGAACQLPELNTILINRNEPIGRRNFDTAHELFHLLTWDAMPPMHLESENPTSKYEKRIEQLADNFASALLMPFRILEIYWVKRGDSEIHQWLNNTAKELKVTSVALKWRLINTGILSNANGDKIDDEQLRYNGYKEENTKEEKPHIFSKKFMELVGWSIEQGHLSVRKAAKTMGMTIDDLSKLFKQYELEPPFEF